MASRIFSRHDASVGMRAHGTSAPVARLFVRSGIDELRVDLEAGPETGAGRAGAVRRVEREGPRLELLDREPVVRAAVLLAVALLLEVGGLAVARRRGDQDHALAEPQGRLDRVGEPAGVRVGDGQLRLGVERPAVLAARGALGRLGMADHIAVDDDLDGVPLVLVELGDVPDVEHLPVDADTDVALPPGALDDAVALGLAVLDERTRGRAAGCPRAGPAPGRRSAGRSGARWRGRWGSAGCRCARTAAAGGRRSR